MTRSSSWFVIAALVAPLAGAACSASSGDHSRGNVAGGAAAVGGSGSGGTGGGTIPGGGSGTNGIAGVGGNAGTGVAAGSGGASGTGGPMREVVTIDDCGPNNAAGLDPAAVATLKAGGPAQGARYLYPYDGTTFPRGMIAPELMWDGAPGDNVYVHLKSSLFEYSGCLKATGMQQLQLPQEVWAKAGDQTQGPKDPFTLELTVQSAGGAVGPFAEQLVIAQATIKGSIFYNSYVSTGAVAGSIYRIPPGAVAQQFIGGPTLCAGCHAVSANGARLITQSAISGPGLSYALTPMSQPNPPSQRAADNPAFVGLSPDGALYVATAHPSGLVRPQGTPLEAIAANEAALYETDTGTQITDTGIPVGAMMPTFSPDATMIAFNDFAESMGKGLVVMDFDQTMRKATNRRVVFTDPQTYPGWPFFLPDNKALIFARGMNAAFSGNGAGVMPGTTAGAPTSDLFVVDIASHTATLLALAMGFKTPQDTTTYLPFGDADAHKDYYPTVSPVAAGGYFWVFFDSIRNYGNRGVQRQLWGTAVTLASDGTYNGDPSHPAFYVTGQQAGSGNHRAFTALDPCLQDGAACTTGIDCCSGFCTNGKCGVPDVPRCSMTNEACKVKTDCCDPADLCIGGFCGEVIPD